MTGKKLTYKKYFQSDEEEVDFKWVGEGQKKNRLMYYKECMVDGTKISINDDVEVTQDSDKIAVGTVLELYQAMQENPHRAKIKWYFTIGEIPYRYRTNFKKPHKQELYKVLDENFIGCMEDIDAEAISGIANVIFSDNIPSNLDESSFFVRHGFGKIATPGKTKTAKKTSVASKHHLEPLKPLPPKNVSSPKRKGSQSVYEGDSVPPDKLTKLTPRRQRKTYNAEQAAAKVTDSDDEELGNISGSESNASSTSTSTKLPLQHPDATNKENINAVSLVVEKTPFKSYEMRHRSKGDSVKPVRLTRRQTMSNVSHVTFVSNEDVLLLNEAKTPVRRTNKLEVKSEQIVRTRKQNQKIRNKQKSSTKIKNEDVFDFPSDEEINAPSSVRRSARKSKVLRKKEKFIVDDADTGDEDFIPSSKESKNDELDEAEISDDVSESDDVIHSEEEEEEEKENKRVKHRKRRTICMSTSRTPSRSVKKVNKSSTMTPGIKSRQKPRLQAKSPLEKARQRLHVSAVPDSLPCRDDEYEDVYSFVYGRLQENTGGCIYISGVPGTGKTATVHEVIKTLQSDADGRNIPYFKFVEINGMKLTDPNQAYCTILKKLTGKKATPDHAASLLDKKFSQPEPKKENVVLLVDEVAAVSGDARRCLDICRRAVEIAESSMLTTSPRKRSKGIVGMKHVESALKEMFSSPKILALQSLSVMETMFMKAIISEFRRTGIEDALFMEVYDQFQSHCRAEGGFEPPNVSEAFAMCNNLGSCRLLLTESGSKDIYQRIRLNVNTDDVLFAFKSKK
ncbi:origin recognition complex subunit 1-like isoform X2 [Hydractinia symbiolongicarpus]|uniref:origin recognition complex subunit 1-like isoform X2 n=1 Tax=Hydractinia symbiolongicarpus TaxID=13093 RepID=UPI00254C71C2|nr:origin recognition complex subunit 1-like isoform X2 [Hydractinia symbiolongicarpus]